MTIVDGKRIKEHIDRQSAIMVRNQCLRLANYQCGETRMVFEKGCTFIVG